MMYQKAIMFNDQEVAGKIMLEPNPRKQKALGREVKSFDNKKWSGKRDHIVEEGNWWKFTQPKEGDLRKMLLKTGDRMLVEACVRDRARHSSRRLSSDRLLRMTEFGVLDTMLRMRKRTEAIGELTCLGRH